MSTTTGFFRNEAQLETLIRLAPNPRTAYIFGCSDGCEPYSLAISYRLSRPVLGLEIRGFDIDEACLARARAATYDETQLDYYKTGKPLAEEKATLFTRAGQGTCRVKEHITRNCTFARGDILDETFIRALPPADLVFCQNVMVHLSEAENWQGIRSLRQLLHPDSLLLIGGMRPSLRSAVTQGVGLVPIKDNAERIHSGWADLRQGWDMTPFYRRKYYFLEPFRYCPDWPFRYGTIFQFHGAKSATISQRKATVG